MRVPTILVAVMSVFPLLACDDRTAALRLPTTPSAPMPRSSPAPPAPDPPAFATIRARVAMTALVPSPGATVLVRDCPPGPAGTHTVLCTDQITATFSVVNDGEARAVHVRVVFADGARECASASLPPAALVTAAPLTFSVSTIFLSSETSEGTGTPVTLVQPCQLPVTTTRIVIQMWDAGDRRFPLAQEVFDGSYTFVR